MFCSVAPSILKTNERLNSFGHAKETIMITKTTKKAGKSRSASKRSAKARGGGDNSGKGAIKGKPRGGGDNSGKGAIARKMSAIAELSGTPPTCINGQTEVAGGRVSSPTSFVCLRLARNRCKLIHLTCNSLLTTSEHLNFVRDRVK